MTPTPANKKKIWFPVLVILVLLVLITAGFRVIRHALGRAGDSFYHPGMALAKLNDTPVQDRSLLSCTNEQLAVMVEQLRNTNRELALSSAAAASLLEENEQLRKFSKLPSRPQWQHVVAEIVLRDPLRYKEFFTINKGSRDGIGPGDAVAVTLDGKKKILVGIVDSCGVRTAKVITVLNPALRLSGKVRDNHAIGFTNSGTLHVPPGKIRFGMLPLRNDYVSGAVVTTTGFERRIPEDLKIGELGSIRKTAEELHNAPDFCCELIPAVEFHKLRFVLVLHCTDRGNR